MTNEELVSLIQNGVNVSENMGILYEQCKRMIHKVVQPFTKYAEYEDLMQEAYFGLHEAVMHNTNSTAAFSTYAYFWVKKAVQKYTLNRIDTIRIPITLREKIRQYYRFVDEYANKHGVFPENEIVKQELNLDEQPLTKLLSYVRMFDCVSLDNPLESGDSLEEFLSDSTDFEKNVIDDICRAEAASKLWEQVDRLPIEQSYAVRGHYLEGRTFPELSELCGVDSSLLGLRCNKAVHKMRKNPIVQEIAKTYDILPYDQALYHDSISKFKTRQSSQVEQYVLRKIGRKERKEEQKREALRLHEMGLSQRVIAARLGLGLTTIKQYFHEIREEAAKSA